MLKTRRRRRYTCLTPLDFGILKEEVPQKFVLSPTLRSNYTVRQWYEKQVITISKVMNNNRIPG